MKCLLIAINAKYIHSNLAVYSLKACAEKEGLETELAEYTINHRASEILDDIYIKKADMLCFSCYIWNIQYVKSLMKDLKKLRPDVPIWLGGPEISFEWEERLKEIPEADGILYGEGERSFPGLLKHCFWGSALPSGCAFRGPGGRIGFTEPAEPVDMDDLPFVYKDMKEFENRIVYYETSRGCPFSCSYCLSSVDKRLRFRSLFLVERELAFFLDNKVPQVKFVDRTFNCRKSHAMAVWRYIRDHDNGITNFHFEIAADLLDEEELSLIRTMRPGLIQLEIGVQSVNPSTICAIRRKMDLEKVRSVVKGIKDGRNVHQHLDLIAGLPWEDHESFGHSFDEVYAMEPSQLQLGFLKVLKGSPMYYDAEKYHILYQSEAPFEVLSTAWLSHGDIIRLKEVEQMVEIYYNSCQFQNTMEALSALFESPFRMYEALGRQYRLLGMDKKKHVRAALYQFLLEFISERFEAETERFRQILTLDYYLREYAKRRPGFAVPEEGYKECIRSRCEAYFPGVPVKQLLRKKHVERFAPPFTEKEEYWLFDYEKRDPLTGNAEVFILHGPEKGREEL
ncbi:B12-binding domain-containing radical SAM protein [Qiania dongpingensis]|uniref:B12-binding domain-containing radical SAM protein n=1 Tax=Qiania dongpingensis TaxID=2763669 RepID=A0A7G9G1J6_9FIRM|nr:B12-binding domain-containing radical SAM protein [Qiania dongpingensis]QNM04678.1 B12-binding domain-containing radical SAM protein [Qiania dongpingensis]